MKNLLIIFLSLIFCFVYYQNNIAYCGGYSYTQKTIAYVEDLNLALNLSKQTNQQVLLVFGASWCVFCQQLKNDLSSLNNIDNKIICIIDTDSNKKLAKKFKVKTLPSSFLLDSDGNIVSNIAGYNFDTYNKWLNQ